MPQIIPIRDLKNTSEISAMCHSSNEPVFITKNGYGDMVVMSMETYEKNMFIHDVEKKLAEAEEAISKGQVRDARKALSDLRKQYELSSCNNSTGEKRFSRYFTIYIQRFICSKGSKWFVGWYIKMLW